MKNASKEKGVKRVWSASDKTSAAASAKRGTQEEMAKRGASNSVLMNLLVSGYDMSAGYVCFAVRKPKKI